VVPDVVWAGFVEMRAKLRKPLTKRASELMLERLADFKRQGQDVVAIVEQSVRNGWLDVYAVKADGGSGTPRNLNRSHQVAAHSAAIGLPLKRNRLTGGNSNAA